MPDFCKMKLPKGGRGHEKKKNYAVVSILTIDPQETKKIILLCQDVL